MDTETKGLEWTDPDHGVFLISWSGADYDDVAAVDDAAGMARFRAAYEAEPVIVMANAPFDTHHLRAAGIVDFMETGHIIHDVQTLARVTMPERGFKGYKLKDLGEACLGADAKDEQTAMKALMKDAGLRTLNATGAYYALWLQFPDEVEAYAKKDTRLTYDVFAHLWAQASPRDREVYEMEMRVAPILRAAEQRGVKVDHGRLGDLKAKLTAERAALREALLMGGFTEGALGDDGEPASRAELLECLLAIGVPLYRRTEKSNELSTNADALREFEDRYPALKQFMEWRGLGKVLSTYVAALERGPRVHTSFNQCAARTSRMSASRPNMQNLPRGKGVRSVLVPDPGNAFVVMDYDSIEVRVLAHYLNNESFIQQLNDGLDMHAMTAYEAREPLSIAANCPASSVRNDYLKGGPCDAIRTVAKNVTFLSLYGGGAPLLSARLGVSVEEAQRIRSAVLDAIPGYWELFDRVVARRRKVTNLTTITGRRLDIPASKQHLLINSIVQGSAAEVMKLGMLAATPALAEWGYQPILVVHDELVGEGPAGYASMALSAGIAAMEGAFTLRCALKATGSYSTDSYSEAK